MLLESRNAPGSLSRILSKSSLYHTAYLCTGLHFLKPGWATVRVWSYTPLTGRVTLICASFHVGKREQGPRYHTRPAHARAYLHDQELVRHGPGAGWVRRRTSGGNRGTTPHFPTRFILSVQLGSNLRLYQARNTEISSPSVLVQRFTRAVNRRLP